MESDEALLGRVRGGDLPAFDLLYARHEARLFGYLRALLGKRADAEEVLHDAFLAALRDRSATFDREGAFRAWLYRIARNHALNRKRADGRHERALAAAPVEGSSNNEGADRAIELRQLEAALTAAVCRLPPVLEELWHLRTSGLSYEQISSVVDAPLGTVKSRMHQMVNVLREELKPWTAPE